MDIWKNVEAEMEQRKAWEEDKSGSEMPIDDLIDYAIYGLQRCEFCEEDCFWIRARMPDPRHYALYEAMRELGKELMMLKIIGNITQDLIPLGITKKGERNNE